MLKNYFIDITKNAINEAIKANELGETKEIGFDLVCDSPKNKEFGDLAINISALARSAKMAPPVIAQVVAKHINQDNFSVNTCIVNDFCFGLLGGRKRRRFVYGRIFGFGNHKRFFATLRRSYRGSFR